MNKTNNSEFSEQAILSEDVKQLLAATAHVAGDKMEEARERLTSAIESGRKMLCQIEDKAVEGAKFTDRAVHEHPYHAIGISLGLGLVIGCLVTGKFATSK
ncbi:MAG: hypothetical protein SH807_10940 [Blastochloris sp.]|nr:hypothetical protein [Blastochloris sp.]